MYASRHTPSGLGRTRTERAPAALEGRSRRRWPGRIADPGTDRGTDSRRPGLPLRTPRVLRFRVERVTSWENRVPVITGPVENPVRRGEMTSEEHIFFRKNKDSSHAFAGAPGIAAPTWRAGFAGAGARVADARSAPEPLPAALVPPCAARGGARARAVGAARQGRGAVGRPAPARTRGVPAPRHVADHARVDGPGPVEPTGTRPARHRAAKAATPEITCSRRDATQGARPDPDRVAGQRHCGRARRHTRPDNADSHSGPRPAPSRCSAGRRARPPRPAYRAGPAKAGESRRRMHFAAARESDRGEMFPAVLRKRPAVIAEPWRTGRRRVWSARTRRRPARSARRG